MTAETRLLAAAMAGDRQALGELAFREDVRVAVLGGRVGPALALRAAEVGVGGPEVAVWHRELMAGTSHGLLLRHSLSGIARVLGREGIAWAPFKGLGLAPHVYPQWDERPTGDIDILVAGGDYERARRVLRESGWHDISDVRGADEFIGDEGYNWQATSADEMILELHFRLWGCAPEGLAAAVLERSQADVAAGSTARRLQLADAYLLAAVHWWTVPPPRLLIHLWDLHRIGAAGGADMVDGVLAETRRWGLQLFVAPLAPVVADLWGDDANRAIAAGALAGVRFPERLALRRIQRAGVETAGLGLVSLARLLARRESRMGWKAVWRRVWPHPAVLRMKTPETWGWARRRAWFVAHRLGLLKG